MGSEMCIRDRCQQGRLDQRRVRRGRVPIPATPDRCVLVERTLPELRRDVDRSALHQLPFGTHGVSRPGCVLALPGHGVRALIVGCGDRSSAGWVYDGEAVAPDVLQLQLPLPQPQPGSERQETLADRLCDLLIRRGRPLEIGHVVAQVLRVRQCPEALQRRLVAEIVDADQRLTWRGKDLVGLAPPGWATTKIRDATYCVVDLETTGGAPGKSKITEIGAVRVRGGEILERFTTLVNPGHEIPAPIMRITGIRNEMLVGQPRIDEVMDRFVEFVGDDVMVAHNAPFDLRFLNFERHRISGRYFTQPWLDTLILARRLLRHRVERFDLGSLAAWANTEIQPNHRALPDAEATGELLSRLIDLMVDRGITTLERAVAFGQTGGARHSHKPVSYTHLTLPTNREV